MKLGQASVRDAKLDRRDRRLDRVDVLPVDVPLANGQAQVAGNGAEGPLDAESAQQAGAANVHSH